MNLLLNAAESIPLDRAGVVTVRTQELLATEETLRGTFSSVRPQPGRYAVLEVADNGSGMDAATQAHIFEPFFTTKEKGKGTGLGLATVYGIVKQSDGYIWVYSEPGRGTSFKIYLPRIAEEASADVIDRSGDAGAIPRGFETVLLVEDESGVRELAREYLETSGYKVIQASNGHEALELAAMYQEPIQLLMTDVVMPGISGRELADRISLIRPDIKILYMSGYTEQAVVHHGIMEEDTILLQKPFTLATLASKLREILAVETVH
jgi:CheY-like chemotaxis protein